MKDHLSPAGNPAPPRPRRSDFLISSMMASRPRANSSFVLSQRPRLRAPARRQSCSPNRLRKMRSSSRSMLLPRSLRTAGFQRRRAAHGRRILPAGLRTDRRLFAPRQTIQQRLQLRRIQVLIEVVIDLNHRRIDAPAQTLDLDQGELAVGCALLEADAQFLLAGLGQVIRTAQPAGRSPADLDMMPPDRL